MAGRPAKLDHVRSRFLAEIKSARSLVTAIAALPKKVNPKVPVGIHPKHERLVVELAFLGMIASWEEFLERSLVRYVAGAESSSYKPVPKYGLATSLSHAYEVITGDSKYEPSKHYLKGNDAKWFLSRADFCFKSHSFACLTPALKLLHLASLIRNRVAHDSSKCKSDFKKAAIDFLQPNPVGAKLQKGYGPGDLLMAKATRHFSKPTGTRFESYADLLESLAKQIVP